MFSSGLTVTLRIGKAASALGAELTRELTPKCSHLVVKSEPAVITAKVICSASAYANI